MRNEAKRILIADDEALTRMGLRTMLRALGHTVVGAAAGGLAALRLANESRPDLAVLDIKMPGMDGLAVDEAIGKQPPAPVAMLTAWASERHSWRSSTGRDRSSARCGRWRRRSWAIRLICPGFRP